MELRLKQKILDNREKVTRMGDAFAKEETKDNPTSQKPPDWARIATSRRVVWPPDWAHLATSRGLVPLSVIQSLIGPPGCENVEGTSRRLVAIRRQPIGR